MVANYMANFSALSMLSCWGADAVSACQICIYGCKKKNRPILSGQAWFCKSAFIYAALKLRRAEKQPLKKLLCMMLISSFYSAITEGRD
jgi:ABC-type Fe3+-siderophore transport system permease subunit